MDKKEDKEEKKVPVFIDGKTISLTPQRSEHTELYSKWMNDPKVRKYAREEMPIKVEDIKKWFEPREGRVQRHIIFEIWHKKDKKPIGTCGLSMIDWINGWANAQLLIGEPEYWNKNIATEAVEMLVEYGFGELNLHKIHGGASVENIGSWTVAEKIGFKYSGIEKDDLYIDGKYHNTKIYRILKEDWMKKRNKNKD